MIFPKRMQLINDRVQNNTQLQDSFRSSFPSHHSLKTFPISLFFNPENNSNMKLENTKSPELPCDKFWGVVFLDKAGLTVCRI